MLLNLFPDLHDVVSGANHAHGVSSPTASAEQLRPPLPSPQKEVVAVGVAAGRRPLQQLHGELEASHPPQAKQGNH